MFSRGSDSAAKSFLYSSVFWLLAGSVALSFAALKLVDPGFVSAKIGSYPRLRAVASLALVYGWLIQSCLAAIFYIVPRTTGARIKSERSGQGAAFLINVGLALGVVVTLLDRVSGHEFLELPRWLAWVLVAALAACASTVIRTVEQRSEPKIYASIYYFIGALVWAPLVIAAGTLPSFAGARDSIAHLFAVNGILTAVFPAVGIGIVYYVVPRASGRPLYSHGLALSGFWWLAFLAPLTGEARRIFGPSPDWLQTLAITASIGLLVPVVTVVVNLFATLRGGWDKVPDHPSIRFAVGGVVVWASSVLVGVALGFRSVAKVLGETSAITTQAWLLVFAFTLWSAAAITYAFPRLVGRRWFRKDRVTMHFWLTAGGAVLLAIGGLGGAIATGGILQTAAVLGKPASAGGRFALVLSATDRFRAAELAGFALFAIGAWVFASNLFRSTTAGQPRAIEVIAPDQDLPAPEGIRNLRLLAGGALAVFIAAFAVAYAAPVASKALADNTRYSVTYPAKTNLAAGKTVYDSEGCWYCHTQSVRAVPADIGLGKVTTADRAVNDAPSVFGLARVGPDLACVGDRYDDAGAIAAHLRNPRVTLSNSTMPAYAYLSGKQLSALAGYLKHLGCGGNK